MTISFRNLPAGARATRLGLLVSGATLAAAGFGAGAAVSASAAGAEPADPTVPAPKTIVDITGSKADGFHIEHYDGTYTFPPTDSEAHAECGEYDTRVARVRCNAEVRTWYRDLGQTQAALDWAHAQAGAAG